jgi:hypothetical protein
VLLQSLQSGAVEDSMQWLAALELPDANVTQMQELQAQERALLAAVDDVLSQPGETPLLHTAGGGKRAPDTLLIVGHTYSAVPVQYQQS